MESSSVSLEFDEQGRCNYCVDSASTLENLKLSSDQVAKSLENLAKEIKSTASGEFDCLIGLSGGVDSSYVAYLAKQMNLKVLAVHFDNGWNSETAVNNIKKIVDRCGFEYVTYVINWPEFKDLQRSFFLAGVLDIEMLTDHAIYAAMFKLAREYKIKHVLSGSNFNTEHGLPKQWSWVKQDIKNIRAIHKQYGKRPLKSFPIMGITKYGLIRAFKLGATFHKPLDMVNYNKTKAMETLKEEFDWNYYGGKHYESTFTKFYQAHVLPHKFGIDKRRAHLSSLIRNGEITREEALAEIDKPLYDPVELSNDLAYVAKKLSFTEDELKKILDESPIPHDHYPSDISYARNLISLWKRLFPHQNHTG
jgi:N-acetyl sugar amidotransferase